MGKVQLILIGLFFGANHARAASQGQRPVRKQASAGKIGLNDVVDVVDAEPRLAPSIVREAKTKAPNDVAEVVDAEQKLASSIVREAKTKAPKKSWQVAADGKIETPHEDIGSTAKTLVRTGKVAADGSIETPHEDIGSTAKTLVRTGKVAADGSIEMTHEDIDAKMKLPSSIVREAKKSAKAAADGTIKIKSAVDATQEQATFIRKQSFSGQVDAYGSQRQSLVSDHYESREHLEEELRELYEENDRLRTDNQNFLEEDVDMKDILANNITQRAGPNEACDPDAADPGCPNLYQCSQSQSKCLKCWGNFHCPPTKMNKCSKSYCAGCEHCLSGPNTGADCLINSDCWEDWCHNGICSVKLANDQPCSSRDECESDYCESSTNKCKNRVATNGACDPDAADTGCKNLHQCSQSQSKCLPCWGNFHCPPTKMSKCSKSYCAGCEHCLPTSAPTPVPCSVMAYEGSANNFDSTAGPCGPYTASSWTDTCTGIDTIIVPARCSIEVASGSNGGGTKWGPFSSNVAVMETNPRIGYDTIRSIRVYRSPV